MMIAKTREFVCSAKDLVNWIFRVSGSLAFVILIWYGGKPLANEKKIVKVEQCIEVVKRDVENTKRDVEEAKKKMELLHEQQIKMNESIIRTEEMTKFLYNEAKRANRSDNANTSD
jgi:hypothetical protein